MRRRVSHGRRADALRHGGDGRTKDLDWIAAQDGRHQGPARSERGGPKTRAMQREVLVKLDEKIKELENKAKGSGQR